MTVCQPSNHRFHHLYKWTQASTDQAIVLRRRELRRFVS